MAKNNTEQAVRTDLADSMYRHAADLKTLAMDPMLSMPKYVAIREGLEQICGKLMSLQADMSFMPFDTKESKI